MIPVQLEILKASKANLIKLDFVKMMFLKFVDISHNKLVVSQLVSTQIKEFIAQNCKFLTQFNIDFDCYKEFNLLDLTGSVNFQLINYSKCSLKNLSATVNGLE